MMMPFQSFSPTQLIGNNNMFPLANMYPQGQLQNMYPQPQFQNVIPQFNAPPVPQQFNQFSQFGPQNQRRIMPPFTQTQVNPFTQTQVNPFQTNPFPQSQSQSLSRTQNIPLTFTPTNTISQNFQQAPGSSPGSFSSSTFPTNSLPSDGLYPEQPIDNDQVRAAKALLSRSRARTVFEMTPGEQNAFSTVQAAFITSNLMENHKLWHGRNSIGGTRAFGTGTILIGMHSQMLSKLNLFVDPSGQWKCPSWDEVRGLPENSFPIDPRYKSIKNSAFRNTNPQLNIPSFFTTAGDQTGVSMYDLLTLESLGEALGLQLHNSGHQLSPEMLDSSISPIDPFFWLWHSFLEGLVQSWLASQNGIVWSSQNRNHGYLSGQGNFDSPTPYASDSECQGQGGSSTSSVCIWLNRMQQLVNPTFS